ncbi:MAG: hypothetical protein ABGY95_03405 [Rubritalea sp.]
MKFIPNTEINSTILQLAQCDNLVSLGDSQKDVVSRMGQPVGDTGNVMLS